jgi:hypothetical protein
VSIEAILIKQIYSFRTAHNMYGELSMTGSITNKRNLQYAIEGKRIASGSYIFLLNEKKKTPTPRHTIHTVNTSAINAKCTRLLARALHSYASQLEECGSTAAFCYSKFKTHELLTFHHKVSACPFTSTPTSSLTTLISRSQ